MTGHVPPEPLGGVVITAREIYDAVVRLSGQLDVLIAQHGETARDVQDHEVRLRSLEKAKWPLPSLAVVASLAALALGILPHII